MTPEELDHRIGISRRTVVGWRISLSTLQPEGSLQMIGDEVDTLDSIAIAYPERADEVALLIDNWEDLAKRLRAKAP
jgi:hypothetical protein